MTHESAEPAAPAPVDRSAGAAQSSGIRSGRSRGLCLLPWRTGLSRTPALAMVVAKGRNSFAAMTNLSKSFRAQIVGKCLRGLAPRSSGQPQQRCDLQIFVAVADKELVECVLIPEKDHYTLCLSTQVGCAMGCAFCTTGRMGLTRNMSAGEIASQVVVARRFLPAGKHGETTAQHRVHGHGRTIAQYAGHAGESAHRDQCPGSGFLLAPRHGLQRRAPAGLESARRVRPGLLGHLAARAHPGTAGNSSCRAPPGPFLWKSSCAPWTPIP